MLFLFQSSIWYNFFSKWVKKGLTFNPKLFRKRVYMQSNLHKIKRSQDASTSRQCTMRPFKGLA